MEEKEKVSKNFIEMAIDKDLEEGVYTGGRRCACR